MWHIVSGAGVVTSGELYQLFPNTGFPASGPTEAFQAENNLRIGRTDPPCPLGKKIVASSPWVDIDGKVYERRAVAMADNELPALLPALMGRVAAQYGAKIAGGFTHNGKVFQIDEASQQRIAAMATRALNSLRDPQAFPWPADFAWIAADNFIVAMTAAQMLSFADAAGEFVRLCRVRARGHKDALLAKTTVEAALLHDVSSGWPE